MKRSVSKAFVTLSILILVGLVPAGSSFGVESWTGDPDVIGCVQIRSFEGLVSKAADLAEEAGVGREIVMRNMAEFGRIFGDPELKNVDGGAPMTLVAFNPEKYREVSLVIGAREPEAVASFLRKGELAAFAEEGHVVISRDPRNLEKTRALLPAVRKLAEQSPGSDILADMALADTLNLYDAQIDRHMQSFLFQAKRQVRDLGRSELPIRILELEMLGYLDVGRQIERLRFEMTFDKEALLFEKKFTAAPNTPLARLIQGAGEVGPEWDRHIPQGAFVSGVFFSRPKALHAFFREEVDRITEGRPTEAEALKGLLEFQGVINGVEEMWASFGMTTSKEEPIGMVSVAKCSGGEPITLDPLKDITGAMQALSAFTKDDQPPMKPVFEEENRVHNDVEIARMRMRANPSAFTPEEYEFLNDYLNKMRFEFAVKDDHFVASMGGQDRMNRALDRLAEEAPSAPTPVLQARKHFPEGGVYYGDMDLVGAFDYVANMVPEAQARLAIPMNLFRNVSRAPVTFYVDAEDGSAQAAMRFPTAPVIGMIQAMKTMMESLSGTMQ